MKRFTDEIWARDLATQLSKSDLPAEPLDAIDRHILRLLQIDALLPNQDLADRVGLSPPACLKRVRRLRARGVIQATVVLIASEAAGYPILVMVRVKLERPQAANMQDFERKMQALPQVVQCLTVAGDIDYVVLLRARDVASYQAFARDVFAADPGIRSYATDMVLDAPKWITTVPLDG